MRPGVRTRYEGAGPRCSPAGARCPATRSPFGGASPGPANRQPDTGVGHSSPYCGARTKAASPRLGHPPGLNLRRGRLALPPAAGAEESWLSCRATAPPRRSSSASVSSNLASSSLPPTAATHLGSPYRYDATQWDARGFDRRGGVCFAPDIRPIRVPLGRLPTTAQRETARDAALARAEKAEQIERDLEGARDAARATIAELVDASERLLEYYSDGLPDHLVDEFRAALAKAKGGTT